MKQINCFMPVNVQGATVLLFLLFCGLVQAQDQTQTLLVEVYGQEHGLQQLNAKTLTRDSLGYVWAGTEDGLHRFNGYSFTTFTANAKDSTSIPDDHIRGLLAVGDTLWIASNSKGILGYQLSKNRFFRLFEKPDNKALNISYNIFRLNGKQLLFSTKNHGILFNLKNRKPYVFELPEIHKENAINGVASINENEFWLSTGSGILKLNLKNKAISPVKGLGRQNTLCLLRQPNRVFVGTEDGLFVFDEALNRFVKRSFEQGVRKIHDLADGKLYIAADEGLFLYNISKDASSKVHLVNRQGKTFEHVLIEDFLSDGKGNVWLGTAGEGVFYVNKFLEKFETQKVRLSSVGEDQRINVFPFYKQTDSILWLGTTEGTVKHNTKNNTYKLYPTGKGGITYAFAEDEHGTLWAGTIFDGLLKYEPQTDSFKQWLSNGQENGLPDNEISDIIPLGDNKLWVTTWAGGITEFNTQTETFIPVLIDGKQLNRVRVHLWDSMGHLWLGNDEGLYKIDENRHILRHYIQDSEGASQLTSNRIFALKEAPDGHIWVGTSSGLTRLNPKTDETALYYKQKGFPNDFVYTLLIAPDQKVWMSTNYGISVLDPDDRTFKSYTKDDGLQDNEFNGKSGYKDDKGNFYFGGVTGFNVFKPEHIVDNPYLPAVQLESVELFNKPVNRNEMFADTLYFKSEENVLTFNYVALNYLNPHKCLYSYKLENFDRDWSPPTKKRSVTYTNLDPGTYRLRIKATNDAGVWNHDGKQLTVIIIPPWYQTVWARLGFAVLALVAAVAFYYYKTSRLKRDKVKLGALVEKRTRDLVKKNEDLEAAYETTRQQRDNIEFLMKELSHRVKNNLQIISSLLNIQANTAKNEKSKDILKMAKNRILTISYVQEELNSKSQGLDIGLFVHNFSTKLIELLSDEAKPKFKTRFNIGEHIKGNINITLLGLILNELITNTFKYAFTTHNEDNLLSVSVNKNNDSLILTVKDNGVGYNPKALETGSLGLEMIGEMVRQLNGKLTVTTQGGVCNTIEVPVKPTELI